jgi:DNA-binding XRE family transcriptional regulator
MAKNKKNILFRYNSTCKGQKNCYNADKKDRKSILLRKEVSMQADNCIRAERARLNLTQSELASKLGVSTQSIQNWEKDIDSCPIRVLVKMTEIFNCSADYLVGLTDKITPYGKR